MKKQASIRLAADIGGKFTDIVLETPTDLYTAKVSTDTGQPELGVLTGVDIVLCEAGITPGSVDVFIHGTTLATNALIEHKGEKTALITTEGFRDSLEIAYENRYDQFDLMIDKPEQLIPRNLLDIDSCKLEAYIFMDWSYGYREKHQEKLPEFVRSKINIGFSEIALEHLYISDCYAYMPRAHISDDLSHERLYIVKDAPVLSRPSYLVYVKSSIDSDIVEMAVAGLRASNREIHLKR